MIARTARLKLWRRLPNPGTELRATVAVYLLNPGDPSFPPVEASEPDGLLAVGGDLTPQRLLTAYSQGIFPWYSDGLPILWHSPDPRFVLDPTHFHLPRSLRKVMSRGSYEVRLDTAFDQVITHCAGSRRPGQRGTWITEEMREAYCTLHEQGFAHSAESWQEDQLVGGLYGVALGSIFFGESMFTRAPDASKVAFATLVEQLVAWDFSLIDCQSHTEHLERFGAEHWPRPRFIEALNRALTSPTRQGTWKLD
jgi:leucyl/phenylalanyl-tRNA--protein transferase